MDKNNDNKDNLSILIIIISISKFWIIWIWKIWYNIILIYNIEFKEDEVAPIIDENNGVYRLPNKTLLRRTLRDFIRVNKYNSIAKAGCRRKVTKDEEEIMRVLMEKTAKENYHGICDSPEEFLYVFFITL